MMIIGGNHRDRERVIVFMQAGLLDEGVKIRKTRFNVIRIARWLWFGGLVVSESVARFQQRIVAREQRVVGVVFRQRRRAVLLEPACLFRHMLDVAEDFVHLPFAFDAGLLFFLPLFFSELGFAFGQFEPPAFFGQRRLPAGFGFDRLATGLVLGGAAGLVLFFS